MAKKNKIVSEKDKKKPLFLRVDDKTKSWIKKEADKTNRSINDYMNEVFKKLRLGKVVLK